MDPFTPIQVDVNPIADEESEASESRPPLPTAIPTSKPDMADATIAIAQNLYILGVIDSQTDASLAGAAEVTGATGSVGEPIAMIDPLDQSDHYDGNAPMSDGDGCIATSFALLLLLTLAASSALAFTR